MRAAVLQILGQADALPVARRLARDFAPLVGMAALGFAVVMLAALVDPRLSLSFEWLGAFLNVAFVLGFVALCLFCAAPGPLAPLFEKAVLVALVYAVIHFTFLSTRTVSYIAQMFSHGWQDALLQRWDRALGFDWWAYARAVKSVPDLLVAQDLAYSYLELPIIVLVVLLVLSGQISAVRDLIYAVFLCAVAVALISVFFPAKGAIAAYDAQSVLAGFGKSTAIYHIKKIEALRGFAPYNMPWQLPGLAAFPSFHMAVGVLLPWAARGHRGLFAVTLAYAVLMVSATPIFGGHYLVDLIAGAGLAGGAIWLTCTLLRQRLRFGPIGVQGLRADLRDLRRELDAGARGA